MRRGTIFWGSVLILLGVVLLLENLGFLGNINVWGIIWPLLIIALGVWIIWGNYFRKEPQHEQISIPLENAQHAHIHLQHGAGRLDIHAGTAPGELLAGDFGGGAEVNKREEGDHLKVKLNTPTQFLPFSWYPGYSLDWNIALSREITLRLELETGASESHIDIGDLLISELHLKTGASSTTIRLPANAGFTRARIESGAASVNIDIPQGVAARIRSRGGLSSLNLDKSRFPLTGNVYQSIEYETAPNKVDIDIQMGVGSVIIQ
jgi:hypothetical protein